MAAKRTFQVFVGFLLAGFAAQLAGFSGIWVVQILANIREAIDLYVQDLIEAGEQIPVNQSTIELLEPAVVVNV